MADAQGSTEQPAELTTEYVRRRGLSLGFAAVGVAPASVLEPAHTVIDMRKRAGLAGDMQFTYRNPARSTTPTRRLPTAQSIVVAALGHPTEADTPDGHGPATAGRLARYVWTDSYARLEQKLEIMAQEFRRAGHRAHVLADTNHLVDRNVAWSAGIGWFGKNANLLLPGSGSWFVLGSILTDAELESTGPPLIDGCGPCTHCIDECPTNAIIAPGVVDARRCIAWLVQAGGHIPIEYREAVGDRMYGCDDCQEVCPPNRSESVAFDEPEPRVDVSWILTATDATILDRYGRWYIADRNVDVIRRTALVVVGNSAEPGWGRLVVEGMLRPFLAGADPILRNHAVWAVRRLSLDVELPICCPAVDLETNDGTVGQCHESGLHAELTADVQARFTSAEWAES